ncbi:MAG TPA: sulfatase-like hydrolase/transferase [archaeon]|nr:sulfatase-like hydrolase/transferase [archaeon]
MAPWKGILVKPGGLITIAIIALSLAGCSRKPEIDQRHPPNILLVVLDAARADHFSCHGYSRSTTPNLDRIAKEGVRFTRAVSTSSWTLPAHASLFTGLLPDEHGTRNQHAWLIDRIPTLAELMKERGYRTGCFTNNPIIDQYHNLVRGFEVIERIWADSTVVTDARPHNTEYTNTLVRSFVEADSERPLFVFINYMDVHQPYVAPEPYRSMYLEAGQEITSKLDSASRYADLLDNGTISLSEVEKSELSAIYDGCLTYLDQQVENLLQSLRRAGVYDSTLIIITSDHGEVFGEYGKFGHGDLLNRPLIHIPLIVRYPALLPSPAEREELVSITDIFYSLSNLLGLKEAAATGSPKRDLFSKKIKEAPCYSSFTLGRFPLELMKHRQDTRSVWTPSNRHYILRGNEAIQCFDLSSDFAEQYNLCPSKVPQQEVVSRIAEMREKVVEFVEDNQDLRITRELKIDPQVVRAMRALGYVGQGRNNENYEIRTSAQEHPHFMEHFKTGNFFFALDSLSAAEEEFRKALEISPQNIRLRIKYSFVLYRNKKYEETARTLHPIIGTAAQDKEVSLILGLAFKEMGKTDRAIEYFGKASELDPSKLVSAMNAAELLMNRRQFGEARVYIQRIMTHHYGNLSALLNIVACYLKNGYPEGARDLLLEQLKKARSGTIYAILSHVYQEMGQENEAEKCRELAAKLGVSRARFDLLKKRLSFEGLKNNN